VNKIFISWSGNSAIAEAIKDTISASFRNDDLSIFVSSESISTGEQWFEAIKNNLSDSKMTIVCITKDNISSPWLYFESGASSFHNFSAKRPLMVILFDVVLPDNSPLSHYNYVKWDKNGFTKLMVDINDALPYSKLDKVQVANMAKGSFDDANRVVSPILKEIRKRHEKCRIETYPDAVDSINKNTLYLACPMASLNDAEYAEMKSLVGSVHSAIIKHCGIREKNIYAPAVRIETKKRFDGSEKAIDDNFTKMKQVEYYVCIYSTNVASSVIAEIGYCIALKKKITIFVNKGVDLPYILSGSDKALAFVKVYESDCRQKSHMTPPLWYNSREGGVFACT
jgi:hypothetical protein